MSQERTVLYLRLSKEDMTGESISESIRNQELILREYAKRQGWRIVNIYIDDDYSGLYEDRPAFRQMIYDAYTNAFDVILAKSQSRFTRNMVHMEKYLHHIFPQLGIRFIGVLDGVDTNQKGNKKARQIYALTNEWYCEDLSENIRMVYHNKMLAGQNLAAYAPYGYQKDEKDHHRLIIDKEAAPVVEQIYHWTVEGWGVTEISHRLDALYIRTPIEYRKGTVHSRNWSVSTLKKILSNPTYIGTLVQGKSERVSYKDKHLRYLKPEKWICIPNHHEAIIDVEEFEHVQNIRRSRRK